jgi:hypothetical protein
VVERREQGHSRMWWSHDAAEQGVEADEAEPEWSFAA